MRRRGEPAAATLLSFIADHESLVVTLDEYPKLTDERLREILREAAKGLQPKRPRAKKKRGPKNALAVTLNTDGASRGNPGPAGAGWVIYDDDGETLLQNHAFLGRQTNNEAEYQAVIGGLTEAVNLGAAEVRLRSDSELLIKQINGQYRVKSPRLVALHQATRDLIQKFRRFEAKHIPREENAAADAQANAAIDAAK